jgi:hypothetical protein
MRTQDVKYIEMKRVAEAKVIINSVLMYFCWLRKETNPLISIISYSDIFSRTLWLIVVMI